MNIIFSVIISVFLLTAAPHAFARSGGYDHGNGGDMCEYRFASVRDDLQSWIAQGGAIYLHLPPTVSHLTYVAEMTEKIRTAKVSCTEAPLFVGSAEKTCKNFVETNGSLHIVCNQNRFLATPEADQYVLVHHEYAGLAGFEMNSDERSNYAISNQITGYLEEQTVKKLVIRPSANPADDPFNPASCTGTQMSLEDSYKLVPIDSENTLVGEFKIHARMRRCDQLGHCQKWEVIQNQARIYDRYREHELILLPTNGMLELSSSNKDHRRIQFRTNFGNSVRRGIIIECGALRKFDGSCAVSDIPKYRFIGDAFGIITAQCARLTYTQKVFVTNSTWLETELVFASRY